MRNYKSSSSSSSSRQKASSPSGGGERKWTGNARLVAPMFSSSSSSVSLCSVLLVLLITTSSFVHPIDARFVSPTASPSSSSGVASPTPSNSSATPAPSSIPATSASLAPGLTTMSPTPAASSSSTTMQPTPSSSMRSSNVTSTTKAPTSPPQSVTTHAPSRHPTTPYPSSMPSKPPITSAPVKPTGKPTATPKPSSSPSPKPTVMHGKPTVAPTTAPPTSTPTAAATLPTTTVTVTGITVNFAGVSNLTPDAITQWTTVTQNWFDAAYNGHSRRRRRRRRMAQQQEEDDLSAASFLRALQQQQSNPQALGIQGMSSTITYKSQNANANGNTITYDQTMRYATKDAANTPSPSELVVIPYNNRTTNNLLSSQLIANVAGFQNMGTPISIPVVNGGSTTPAPSPTPSSGSKSGPLSLGAIIGIAVGGAAVLILVVVILFTTMGRGKGGNGTSGSGTAGASAYPSSGAAQPPSQFQLSAGIPEDISTIDDTIQKAHTDTGSLAEYGDQSVATVDYDYSKAYGGGGAESVVSSAGGTMGENTRHTAGDVAGTSLAARAALGASFDSEAGGYREAETSNVKEEVIEIIAPAGKLGVVIDTPDDGAPVVHAVKDSSVIADQIHVGDKLIAVDDEDVRSMTAIKVSKLISKKSANPARKLTIVRTTYVDE